MICKWLVIFYKRGVFLNKKAIKIKVYAPMSTAALEDMQSLIEFVDDFPGWNSEPDIKFFVEKQPNRR